jgi:hypothetical protein
VKKATKTAATNPNIQARNWVAFTQPLARTCSANIPIASPLKAIAL